MGQQPSRKGTAPAMRSSWVRSPSVSTKICQHRLIGFGPRHFKPLTAGSSPAADIKIFGSVVQWKYLWFAPRGHRFESDMCPLNKSKSQIWCMPIFIAKSLDIIEDILKLKDPAKIRLRVMGLDTEIALNKLQEIQNLKNFLKNRGLQKEKLYYI